MGNYQNRWVAYIFVTLALLGLSGCSDSKSTKTLPRPSVSVIKVSTTTIPLSRDYIGITQSIASIDIRARVKGFLTKMNFIEGKLVKKDQLLFVIDPQPFEAKLSLAKGKLAKSIANKEYQQIQYLRMKELVAKGDVSKTHFDEVSAKFGEAVAQVEVDSSEVDVAKINLSYCSMYSPIDGLISHKYVDVGNLVGGLESTLLANVVKLEPLYVQFSPNVDDFNNFLKYRDNMPFKVEVTLPKNENMVFTGKIDLVNNQADVPTSTILMRAIIDNPKSLLLPGIYVNLKLHLTDKYPAILVPMKAVVEIQGQRSLYVVGAGNKVEQRIIQVGGQYKESYIVTSGLKDGETIIASNLQRIRTGEVITPISGSK